MPDNVFIEFALRLGLALSLGAFIGLERQYSHHTAGLKTNALVSTGAALFAMLPLSLGWSNEAESRIAAQVISGIGFLGGGVILRDGLHIRGLTTAATLWCAAAIGTLTGAGALRQAVGGTVAILAINIVLKPISLRLGEDPAMGEGVPSRIRLRIICRMGDEQSIRQEMFQLAQSRQLKVEAMKTEWLNDQDAQVSGEFCGVPEKATDPQLFESVFHGRPGIKTVDWEHVATH